jgi:4-azaleucine resistance transporter AzlC
MDGVYSNRAVLAFSFKTSLPVLAGYLGIGLGFGILMAEQGYNCWWAALFSLIAYGGTIQYLCIALLSTAYNPAEAFLLSLLVNFRHIFYGITMADRYKGYGLKKLPLIFGLSDETFSLVSSVEVPEGMDRYRFYLFLTILNHSYWIIGSFLGALIGASVPIDYTGVEFALTALFVVLFMEQIRNSSNILPGIIGLGSALICLLVFGDNMIIPSMALIALILLAWRRYDVHRH